MADVAETRPLTDLLNDILDADTFISAVRASTIAKDLSASTPTEIVGSDFKVWFKSALDAGEVTTLDAIIAAHTGVAATPPEAVLTQVSPSGSMAEETKLGGANSLITKATTDTVDYVFAATSLFNGAAAHAWDAYKGDYIDLIVIDNSGTPVEIKTIAVGVPVPPDGIIPMITSHKTETIPAGYGIRLKYYSAAGATVDPHIGLHVKYLITP